MIIGSNRHRRRANMFSVAHCQARGRFLSKTLRWESGSTTSNMGARARVLPSELILEQTTQHYSMFLICLITLDVNQYTTIENYKLP